MLHPPRTCILGVLPGVRTSQSWRQHPPLDRQARQHCNGQTAACRTPEGQEQEKDAGQQADINKAGKGECRAVVRYALHKQCA